MTQTVKLLMRILLVEDEPDVGKALKEMLNQQNYTVDWVWDGEQAWDYLENHWTQYDLAIFDWLLPGLTGIDLLQKIRQQNSSLPVLMLSVKNAVEDRIEALDAGADYYLVKPFNRGELFAVLRALQRRSTQLKPQQLTLGCLTLDYANNSVYITDSVEEKKMYH